MGKDVLVSSCPSNVDMDYMYSVLIFSCLNSENAPKQSSKDQRQQKIVKSEVRVVSFDLDNTIWKTGAVISSANDELARHMESLGVDVPVRVEKVMGILFKENKAKYCPLHASDDNLDLDYVKAPVLLTQLRKDAVLEVLRNQTIEIEYDLDQLAEEAFQVWTEARHSAIPLNLASSVLESLEEIRSMKTKTGQNVVVGAITDGNSDPRKVEILRDFFDFVINAEQVGISKPDRRVYDAAIQHVSANDDLNHVFDEEIRENFDMLIDRLGPYWVHVGDDFIKDIVAAKDISMRSIWSRELVLDKYKAKEPSVPKPSNEADFNKAMANNKVVNMVIGTEDYLTDEVHSEFADAIVDNFRHVAQVITEWHKDGLETDDVETKSVDLPDYFEVVIPDEKVTEIPEVESEEAKKSDTKFCIECGEKLLRSAKFCSSCGFTQP